MTGLTRQQLQNTLELHRVETLFKRLPASITSVMIGVLLVFVFLLPVAGESLLKAWAAFMLTTLALRGWVWHTFLGAVHPESNLARWEWAFAGGMFLTALGWAGLNGPLYPDEPKLQVFVFLMSVITAFAGTIYVSVSNLAFWLFLIPTLGPALVRYVLSAENNLHAPLMASIACLTVLIFIQRTLRSFALEHIRRQVEAETLLAEQQAIFQAAPLGILVISESRVVKSNSRLGELFQRSLQDLQIIGLHQLFATEDETEKFVHDSRSVLAANKAWYGIYRMRRADGSEFWAELSGRLMHEKGLRRSVWTIADVTSRVEGTVQRS
jgi:PAS domain S-box-containing protein